MAIEAPVASPRVASLRAAFTSSRRQALWALAVYTALSLDFFGVRALPHLGHVCVCGAHGNDPATYMWNLAWWPHALLHGINPFLTNAVFAPDRLDIGAFTLFPAAAFVATPVTLLFGPFVSYNLIALASPILASLFAFLLCRYVTRDFLAGLFGGYLFGFTAYMLGHMGGHLDLLLTFPIPAGVHLVLRLIDERISHRRFTALMALDLAALIAFSTELALTFVLVGTVTLALGLALAPASRARITAAIRPIAIAGALAVLVTSPVIYYAIKGNVVGPFNAAGDIWGGDGLGFLIPTRVTALGSGPFAAVSSAFTQNDVAESGIYLGLPVLLIMARHIVTRWRLPVVRVAFAAGLVVSVLLLGAHLHIDGHSTISLPWRAIGAIPLLKEALPVRLGLYLFLIAALIVAMWTASPRAGAWGIAKWALLAASVAFLFPNVSGGLWHSRPSNPRFFTTTEYRRYLHRGETVLTLPWPGLGSKGYGMLWQAETGMWFRLAGGNLGKLVPASYRRESIMRAFFDPERVNEAGALRSFIVRHQVGAVIVDSADPQQWPGMLARLGLRAVHIGGVLFYRVRRAPGAPSIRAARAGSSPD